MVMEFDRGVVRPSDGQPVGEPGRTSVGGTDEHSRSQLFVERLKAVVQDPVLCPTLWPRIKYLILPELEETGRITKEQADEIRQVGDEAITAWARG